MLQQHIFESGVPMGANDLGGGGTHLYQFPLVTV